jgi:uncharacterized protein DUF6632
MERALKVVLVVVGLLFVATIYPLLMFLWQPHPAEAALTMMISVYTTLGVFLLVAARNPSAHRSLIAFTAWSSFAHAAVMVMQSFQMSSERVHLLIGSAFLAVIGLALIMLAPAKPSMQPASAVGA